MPNYMLNGSEEDYDATWVDPDEGSARLRANRMAVAGHQQMQGQVRDRRLIQDHQNTPQYAGPHSISPPIAATQYPTVSKRPPVSISAAIAQTNRLNYGITAANTMSRNSISPSLGHRDSLKEASPSSPAFNVRNHVPETNDFDSWSLTSQHLRQPDVNYGTSSIASRPIGMCDPHSSDQRRALQQMQQQQVRVVILEALPTCGTSWLLKGVLIAAVTSQLPFLSFLPLFSLTSL